MVVVVYGTSARMFHIMRLDTRSNEIEHGSWFRGRFYSMSLSPSGKWLAYHAMGAKGKNWAAVCEAPWLTAHVHIDFKDTWTREVGWLAPGKAFIRARPDNMVRQWSRSPLVESPRYSKLRRKPFSVVIHDSPGKLDAAILPDLIADSDARKHSSDVSDRITLTDRTVLVALPEGIQRWSGRRKLFEYSFATLKAPSAKTPHPTTFQTSDPLPETRPPA